MDSYRNGEPHPPIMRGSPPKMVPPRLDWDRPPWNRWSCQPIREIVPTVEVWRGEMPVRALPNAPVDLEALPVVDSVGSPTSLIGLLDETYTDGFLVLKNGTVVFERYFNGMTPRTLHLSQSMAKSVTASVCGILVGRGLIDPAALVTDYLPDLSNTGWAGASVQHVLDMTTGVRFSEEYTDPYSEMGQTDVAAGWKPIPPGSDPDFKWPSNVWDLILGLKDRTRPHGAAFEYRSIETDVLAFIMERVSGKRLAELISHELWQKIGVEESACFTVDSAGYALADGGFNATLRDYGRFGQMLLENGGGIVPAQWIETTRTSVHGPHFNESLPEGGYHNQFWIVDPRSRALTCRGVFGQLIHIDWDNQMVVVKLSTYPDFTNTAYSIATRKAIDAIAAALG